MGLVNLSWESKFKRESKKRTIEFTYIFVFRNEFAVLVKYQILFFFFIFTFKDCCTLLQLTLIICHSLNDLFTSQETCSFQTSHLNVQRQASNLSVIRLPSPFASTSNHLPGYNYIPYLHF